MTKWVKYPSAGEFRGQGKWVDITKMPRDSETTQADIDAAWDYWKLTGYLPVAEGDNPPED